MQPSLLALNILYFACFVTPAFSAPIFSSRSCWQQDETIFWNMIIFFATNYVAHAASVPSSLDADTFIRIGKTTTISWPPIVALFLPAAGLFRSCFLMVPAYYISCLDEVHKALMSGAMMMVARTAHWEPSTEREELVYVQLPSRYEQISEADAAMSFATFDLRFHDEKFEEIDPVEWKLFGNTRLPKGYTCGIHQGSGQVEFATNLLASNLEDTSGIKLCRPKSWMKVALSIFQLGSAIVTLYDTRGDQINRYGYAAYGLTVIPYALMSLVNMLCAGHRGDWPCRYMLRTAILQEAERRPGALFDGAVGTLKGMEEDEEEELQKDVVPLPGYTAACLSLEEPTGASSLRILVVRVGQVTKRFKFGPGLPYDSDVHTFGIASINDRMSRSALSHTQFFKQHYPLLSFSFLILAINFAVILVMLYASLIGPYVIIHMLTGFKAQGSTAAQRGWLMAWLVVSQVAGFVWGFIFSAKVSRLLFWILIPILITPALGGFYTVGMMYLDDKGYGQCQ